MKKIILMSVILGFVLSFYWFQKTHIVNTDYGVYPKEVEFSQGMSLMPEQSTKATIMISVEEN